MANHSKQQVVTPPLTNFPIITMEAKQEVRQELGRTTILDIVNSTINNTGSSNHNQDPMDNQSLNKVGIILGPGPILVVVNLSSSNSLNSSKINRKDVIITREPLIMCNSAKTGPMLSDEPLFFDQSSLDLIFLSRKYSYFFLKLLVQESFT